LGPLSKKRCSICVSSGKDSEETPCVPYQTDNDDDGVESGDNNDSDEKLI
jgi:hypothetical protein